MIIIYNKLTGEIYSFASGNDQKMETMFPNNYEELKQIYGEVQIDAESVPEFYTLKLYKIDINTKLLIKR